MVNSVPLLHMWNSESCLTVYGLPPRSVFLGRSRGQTEISYGGLAHRLQAKGIWVFGDSQYKAHESIPYAQMDLETLPELRGAMGRPD
jgi:hypothetical protein